LAIGETKKSQQPTRNTVETEIQKNKLTKKIPLKLNSEGTKTKGRRKIASKIAI